MSAPIPESIIEEIKADLRAGQKISAIKRLREASGLGLAESKVAIENLHAELHAKDPAAYPAGIHVGGGGCLVIILAMVVVIAVALFFLLRSR